MYNYLNNETNRKLKLIEILHRRDDWVSLTTIAEELDCSDKILRSDIKKINIDFEPFVIISSPKGVLLEYPRHINIDYVYSYILKNSLEYQIIELIFLKPLITVTELAETIYSSETGIRRKIKELKQKLLPSGFWIELQDSRCQLVGDEVQIRNFLVFYFSEKMYDDPEPFRLAEHQVVEKLIDHVVVDNNRSYGLDTRRALKNYLIISLRRLISGAHLVDEEQENSAKVNRPLAFNHLLRDYAFAREFQHVFQLPFTESVLNELFYVFMTYSFALPNRGTNFDETLFFANIGQNIGERIALVSDKLQLPIHNMEQIIQRVTVDLAIYIGPLFVLHDRNKLFVSSLEQSYPFFIKHLKTDIASFSQLHDVVFEESLVNQLIFSTVIEWQGLLTYLKSYRETIKLALLVDSAPQHANYLSELIEFRMGRSLDITCLFISETTKQQLEIEKPQLVITTISEYDTQDIPTICIDRNPSLSDLKIIQSMIESISQKEFQRRLLQKPEN